MKYKDFAIALTTIEFFAINAIVSKTKSKVQLATSQVNLKLLGKGVEKIYIFLFLIFVLLLIRWFEIKFIAFVLIYILKIFIYKL